MRILSDPIVLREHIVSSRCFLAPINTGYAERGNPTGRLMNFHSARSGKGIGITFVGTTAISRDTAPNQNTLVLDSQSDLDSFEELSNRIRMNGSLPGIQLGCRLTNITPARAWRTDSIEQSISRIREEVSSYSGRTFVEVLEGFRQSIGLAVKTGYEVIQLHAAHGYFLSLLLCPILNTRRDEFGFPKCSLLFRIIEETKQSYPAVILGIRMNCVYGLEDRNKELERAIDMVARLFEAGVDIIDFSAGLYDIDKNMIYPSLSDDHAWHLPYALRVRREIGGDLGIISFAGNVWDLTRVDEVLEDNMAVCIGRSLIADPGFVSKYFNNCREEIIPCMREKTCPCHYFSRGRTCIECSVNEDLGQAI